MDDSVYVGFEQSPRDVWLCVGGSIGLRVDIEEILIKIRKSRE
jgi:hypothetical protein